eukprot:6641585-Alexandrium_andersonii.AAC.1
MSASLVGSEMCIRDRPAAPWRGRKKCLTHRPPPSQASSFLMSDKEVLLPCASDRMVHSPTNAMRAKMTRRQWH